MAEYWTQLLNNLPFDKQYLVLGLVSLLPALMTAAIYTLDKRTKLGRLPYAWKQILIGIVFGAIAVMGTEYGVSINGAQVNCRDAAVLCSGLMFGGPAGIIAGLIGGVERWFAVYWGVGTFTRVACSVSTILIGFFAALLRKFMFEDKKPSGVLLPFAIGVVMEVFHLTMVFLTNMNTPERAMSVVRACSLPMIIANGCSVMIAAVLLSVLSKERVGFGRDKVRISQTIQRWLLITVVLAFIATSYFVFRLQNTMAQSQTDTLLTLALEDVSGAISDTSDANLLSVSRRVAHVASVNNLDSVAQEYGVSEINIVDQTGVIIASTEPAFVGFDFNCGDQSSEFLCLLGGTAEYIQPYGPISYDASVYRKYAGIATGNGFVQVGYDAEDFQKDITAQVANATKNRHVGQTGYTLIFDQELNLVSAPDGISRSSVKSETSGKEVPDEETTFLMTLNKEEVYCRFTNVEGYYVLSVLPKAEAMQMRNTALYVNAFMEILVFAVLFGMIYMLIKRVVVNQIKNINESLSKITGGDLNIIVNVRTNEEFASLSDDINTTVDTLKKYIAEASARIDKELEFAKSIQSSSLPSVFPAFPNHKEFDIYASMNPAKEVGGDFYDFYLTHDSVLHFLIADVSGKGIPAAMFMMRAKTELKTLTEADFPLDVVFTGGNQALCEGNDAGMFVTAWQGGLDLATGKVQFANAGHNPPLVRRGDAAFEYLRSHVGFVLAGMEDVKYIVQEIQLQPGDTIFLYTDGVTEATNDREELYGEGRLLSVINSLTSCDMKELCEEIKRDVDRFVGDAPQFDDITMVAMKYLGNKTKAKKPKKQEDVSHG